MFGVASDVDNFVLYESSKRDWMMSMVLAVESERTGTNYKNEFEGLKWPSIS
jgi:hypothetical protein